MTKAELLYDLTRGILGAAPDDTSIFIERLIQDDHVGFIAPLKITEIDTINGKQRIVLS